MKATETKELSIVKQQITKATTAAQELVVDSKEGLEMASDLLSKIKKVGKLAKEKKESFTRPAYEAYKQIMAQAKSTYDPLIEDCDRAEAIVKDKALVYQKKVNEEARKEQERIAEEARKKAEKAPEKEEKILAKAQEKIEQVETVGTKVEGVRGGSMTFKKVKEVVIVDAALIPRAYLELNMKLIKADALSGVSIPGVKVEEKEVVAGSF